MQVSYKHQPNRYNIIQISYKRMCLYDVRYTIKA